MSLGWFQELWNFNLPSGVADAAGHRSGPDIGQFLPLHAGSEQKKKVGILIQPFLPGN